MEPQHNMEKLRKAGNVEKEANSLWNQLIASLTGLSFEREVWGQNEWLHIRTPNPTVMFVIEIRKDGQIGVSQIDPRSSSLDGFVGHDIATDDVVEIYEYLIPLLRKQMRIK